MKTHMNQIAMTVATVLLSVIFVAGVRERIVNIPKWFANPPASFDIIRQQAPHAQRFWIPLQALFLTALIFAFITNWKYKEVRAMLLIGTAAFLLVVILTAAYYVKEVMAFTKLPPNTPATPELLKRANTWYSTTIVRNILQGGALVFFIIGTIRSFEG